MSTTSQITFDNPLDFTFDPVKIDVSASMACLAPITYDSEIYYFAFSEDGSLDSERGSQTLTLSNTGTVTGGWLELTNDDASYATVSAPSQSAGGRMAMTMKVRVNFTTIFSEQTILNAQDPAGLSRVRIYFQNQGAGVTRVRGTITDTAGTITLSPLLGLFTFSVGDIIEVGFSRDNTAECKFYLNGIATSLGANSLTFPSLDLSIGSAPLLTNFSVTELQVWNGLANLDLSIAGGGLRPTAYTYYTDSPDVLTNSEFPMTQLIDFIGTNISENPPETDVKYILTVDGQDMYYDTVSWVNSDGSFAQSNDPNEILAGLILFNNMISSGSTIRVKTLLNTATGFETPCADNITLQYNRYIQPTVLTKCDVLVETVDLFGKPINNMLITVEANESTPNGNALLFKSAQAKTNYQGTVSIPVVETQTTSSTVDFVFTYLDVDGVTKKQRFSDIIIPNQSSVNFTALI